jgi:hypothetical protein
LPTVPSREAISGLCRSCYNAEMRDLVILFVHVIVTLCRLWLPGGVRSVVAESVLVKQQLLILTRSRKRAPNLRACDRFIAGLCSLCMKPTRLIRSAIALKPLRISGRIPRGFNTTIFPESAAGPKNGMSAAIRRKSRLRTTHMIFSPNNFLEDILCPALYDARTDDKGIQSACGNY